MKKYWFIILPLLISLFAACAGSNWESPSVYRVLKQEYQINGQLLIEENVHLSEGESALDALLNALQSPAIDGISYNPLAEVQILSIEIEDGTALLSLNREYNKLHGLDKTLCDACLVMTLCALEDIDRLNIMVDGEIMSQNLTTSDIVLSDSSSDPNQREVCLYFMDEDGGMLVPEYRTLSISDELEIERYVIEELLRPAQTTNLRSPLPEGTELLGISRDGRDCVINLSSEFWDNKPETATGELLTVYSLVNSVTSLGNITNVSIVVNGQPISRYVNLSLTEPLTRCDSIVSQGGEAGYHLYYRYGNSLFGIPHYISATSGLEQALLDALMAADDFGPYSSMFTSVDELRFVELAAGNCTVSVSRSFFERRSEFEANLALEALAKTLLELDKLYSVYISYPDGSIPNTPGHYYGLPIEVNATIIK